MPVGVNELNYALINSIKLEYSRCVAQFDYNILMFCIRNFNLHQNFRLLILFVEFF